MSNVSERKFLQLHFIGLIKSVADDIATDGRQVTVSGEIPVDAFSQKLMPRVLVSMPRITERASWTYHQWRVEFQVPMLVLDKSNVTHGKRANATDSDEGRLSMMVSRLVESLSGIPNLGLCRYSLFNHFVDWDEGQDVEEFGNMLIGMPVTASFPMIFDRGKQFDSDDATGALQLDLWDPADTD